MNNNDQLIINQLSSTLSEFQQLIPSSVESKELKLPRPPKNHSCHYPRYWKNRSGNFNTKETCSEEMRFAVQDWIQKTFNVEQIGRGKDCRENYVYKKAVVHNVRYFVL